MDMQFAYVVVMRIEVGGDAGPEIDAIADEALVAVLDGFDQRLARISAPVINGNRTAVERLPGVVGQFRGA